MEQSNFMVWEEERDDVSKFIDEVLKEEGVKGDFESGLDQKKSHDEQFAREEKLIRETITAAIKAATTSDMQKDIPHTEKAVSKIPIVQDVSFALEMHNRSLHPPREFLTESQREMLKKLRAKYESMV